MLSYLFGTRGRIGRLEFSVLVPFTLSGILIGASVWLRQFADLASAIEDLGWEALIPTLIFPEEHLMGTAAILVLFIAWCVLARGYAVKRLHDRDRGGWWLMPVAVAPLVFLELVFGSFGGPERIALYGLFAVLVAIILWLMAELFLRPGTAGKNRFGPNPRPEPVAASDETPVAERPI